MREINAGQEENRCWRRLGLGESKFCALALEGGAWGGLLDGDELCLGGPEELGGPGPCAFCPSSPFCLRRQGKESGEGGTASPRHTMLLLNGKLWPGCRVKFVKFWAQSLLPASPHQEPPHRAGKHPQRPCNPQKAFILGGFPLICTCEALPELPVSDGEQSKAGDGWGPLVSPPQAPQPCF